MRRYTAVTGRRVSAFRIERLRAEGIVRRPPERLRGLVLEQQIPDEEVEELVEVEQLVERFPRRRDLVVCLLAARGRELDPDRVTASLLMMFQRERARRHSPRTYSAARGGGRRLAEQLRQAGGESEGKAILADTTVIRDRELVQVEQPSLERFLEIRARSLRGERLTPLSEFLVDAKARLTAAPAPLIVGALRAAYLAAQGPEHRARRERIGRPADDFEPDVPYVALDLLTTPGSPYVVRRDEGVFETLSAEQIPALSDGGAGSAQA